MPLLLAAMVMLGVSETLGWRVALIVPGVLMLVMAVVYWRYTQDCPQGNFSELRAAGIPSKAGKKGGWDSFKAGLPPTTASGCCSSPTAPASASRSSSTTSPPSITSTISACRWRRPAWRPAASACWRCSPAPWAAGCRTRCAARGNLNSRVTLLFVLMIGEGAGLLLVRERRRRRRCR
jgi:NNP family nitrate/nitrite transporter-like MFS transporter